MTGDCNLVLFYFFAIFTSYIMRKEELNMTYKQIEAAREARLWLGQIVLPTVTVVATAMSIPEVREAVATKAKSVTDSIKRKLKKEEA